MNLTFYTLAVSPAGEAIKNALNAVKNVFTSDDNFLGSSINYLIAIYKYIENLAAETVEFMKLTWMVVDIPFVVTPSIVFWPLLLCISFVCLVGMIKVLLGWGNT